MWGTLLEFVTLTVNVITPLRGDTAIGAGKRVFANFKDPKNVSHLKKMLFCFGKQIVLNNSEHEHVVEWEKSYSLGGKLPPCG